MYYISLQVLRVLIGIKRLNVFIILKVLKKQNVGADCKTLEIKRETFSRLRMRHRILSERCWCVLYSMVSLLVLWK